MMLSNYMTHMDFRLTLQKRFFFEKGFTVDEEGFAASMEIQRSTARNAREESNFMGAKETVYQQIDADITSSFVGYDRLSHISDVLVLTTDTEITDKLNEGEHGTIIVSETPFYATMGGQMADTGVN